MRFVLANCALFLALVATTATPALCATQAGAITTVTLAADARSVQVTFANGSSRTLRVEDAGDTFGPPRVRDDHLVAAWPELRHETGSYDLAISIAVYAAGKLHHVECDGGSPSSWRFERYNRIVLKCAFPHGPGNAWLQRMDVATGAPAGRVKLVGDAVAVPPTAPAWAHRIP